MTAQFLTLEIDGVPVPAEAMGRLQVDYEDLEARQDRRTAGGAFNRRVAWTGKLRATISGEGFCPPGLDGIDSATTYSVAFPKQREITSASNVITLPAARRSGGLYDPVAFAIVDGMLVPTAVSVVTDTATCTVVSGATAYRVDYYPQITAYLAPGIQQLDAEQRKHRWQLVVEEA